MDRPLSDIYWLNVADEGFPFGGIIEHTNFVPAAAYAGRHIAYLSRYYTADEPLASMDEAGIKSLMLSGVKRIFPSFSESHLHAVHVFRSRTAAQVCDLGFSEKVPACKTPIQGLFIGNMSHVYPDERSVNNSIRVAAAACEQMGLQHKVPQNASLSGNIGFHQSSN
jgi:protoporphyrinogen oxidase